MDSKHHNPGANVPAQGQDEPRGDRGRGDKTWAPGAEQGISNRPGDPSQPQGAVADEHGTLSRDEGIENNVEREENKNAETGRQQQPDRRPRLAR